jgi:hypothetical protein
MEKRKNRRRAIGWAPWPKHFVQAGTFGNGMGEGTGGCDSKIKREESTSSLFISFSFLQRTVDLL